MLFVALASDAALSVKVLLFGFFMLSSSSVLASWSPSSCSCTLCRSGADACRENGQCGCENVEPSNSFVVGSFTLVQAASIITNNMEEAAHAERAAETMAEDGDQSGVDFEDDGGESDEEDGNAAPGDAHLQYDLLGHDGATPG